MRWTVHVERMDGGRLPTMAMSHWRVVEGEGGDRVCDGRTVLRGILGWLVGMEIGGSARAVGRWRWRVLASGASSQLVLSFSPLVYGEREIQ